MQNGLGILRRGNIQDPKRQEIFPRSAELRLDQDALSALNFNAELGLRAPRGGILPNLYAGR